MPGADLGSRLHREAERLDVADVPASRIARRGRRRARSRAVGTVAVVAMLLLGAAGVGWVSQQGQERRAASPEASEAQGVKPRRLTGNQRGEEPAPRAEGGTDTTEFASTSGGGGGSAGTTTPGVDEALLGAEGSAPQGGGLTPVGPRIIKSAQIRVEVDEGAFGPAFSEAQRIAGRYGGFVAETATSSNPARSGDLTIRVPSERFEAAVADLRALGVVESARARGEDVTAEFVDIEARLRNLEAHEEVLLRLNREADTIAESLQVQRELQRVQLEIERLAGQLRVLDDQTSFGTITLHLHEAGVREPRGEPSAWRRALTAAGNVIDAIVIGLGYLVPIGAVLLVLWLASRAVRSRRAD